MKKIALIVAGGSGSRMKNEVPKQFLELKGKPVLMHVLDVFCNYDALMELIVVLPKAQLSFWDELCRQYNFTRAHKVATGGENRFQSVKNGLDLIDDDGIVFIHDGVRPLVSQNTIQKCFEMACEKGNALPVVSVSESVRFTDDRTNKAVDRSKYVLVQTPQTFQVSLIKEAYEEDYDPDFTDDASVLESMGEKICLVEGNRENIKITFPEDMLLANAIIK